MMIVMTSCDEKNAEVTEYHIIPEPAYMVQKARSFSFSSRTKLYFENLAQNSSTTKFITNTLRKMHIRPAFIGTPNRGSITITLNDTINPSLGEEGYLLQVLPDGIFISANTEAGLIYAFETFIQMLPEDLHQQPHGHITLRRSISVQQYTVAFPDKFINRSVYTLRRGNTRIAKAEIKNIFSTQQRFSSP
jgi:N-acetyl-beta-hexosaminidase